MEQNLLSFRLQLLIQRGPVSINVFDAETGTDIILLLILHTDKDPLMLLSRLPSFFICSVTTVLITIFSQLAQLIQGPAAQLFHCLYA